MSRKRMPINPEAGRRLKSLLVTKGIQQGEFADRIGYTEQHISQIIGGKRRLTPEAAQKVVELIPGTRFEWLMGYDRFETDGARSQEDFERRKKGTSACYTFMGEVAKSLGYDVGEISDPCVEVGICVTNDDGTAKNIPLEKYTDIAREIVHYSTFLLKDLLMGPETEGKFLLSPELMTFSSSLKERET